MRSSPLIAAALSLGLSACQPADQTSTRTTTGKDSVRSSVEITDAWCRPTPNGARAGACYLTLKASGDDRLVGVATPAAEMAQVHDMTMEDGIMRMNEMAGGLPLAAGQVVTLAPGGRHLMLTGLAAPLAPGEQIPLTLTFAQAPAMPVQATVRQPTTTGEDDAGH